MRGRKRAFPLLSLPWLPLVHVVKSLSKEDKQAAAGACRSLAAAVSAASHGTKLTVLATNTITCKTLELVGHLATEDQPADSALYILLSSDNVLSFSLPGVQRVVLNARPLPCLLPPNLARILPGLKELTLMVDYETYANLQPLPVCSTLTAISFHGQHSNMQHLPNKYHTPDHLRQQLPNITFLRFCHEKCSGQVQPNIVTMLKAWGDQLTSLELDTYIEPGHLQHCTRLQSLTWGFLRPDLSPSYIPQSLIRLTVHSHIRAGELGTILKLPLLQIFECRSIIEDRYADRWLCEWSGHPCTWKQLRIHSLDITDLVKLPLRSLQGDGGMYIKCLTLPDPYSPDSLSEVRRAVQHIKEVGITNNGLQRWECACWKRSYADPHLDIKSAELFLTASTVVKPPSRFVCNWASISHYHQTVTAVVDWLSHTVRNVVIPFGKGLPRWLWQALQRCSALRHVKWSFDGDLMFVRCELVGQVLLAAQDIVAVNLTPFLVEVECRADTLLSGTIMVEAASHLKKQLPRCLPSSVMLKGLTSTPQLLSIYLHPTKQKGSMDIQQRSTRRCIVM